MKRVFLFIFTNLAVMLVLGVAASLLGVNRYLTANGLDLSALLGFAALMGFGGAFISLLISKPVAKWSTGAQVINDSPDPTHQWLVTTVKRFADESGVRMPEVAIFEGDPNAFATGAFKNSALVAVSTGLLQGMNREEVEAVIGHEVAHIANGDMVTMTLLQGVLNTFVVFLSRVLGYVIDLALRRGDDRGGLGIGYFIGSFVTQILLGLLATMIVMGYSRRREFRADAMGAQLAGKPAMTGALQRLRQIMNQGGPLDDRAASVSAMKISNKSGRNGLMALFASHPPLEKRLAALERLQV